MKVKMLRRLRNRYSFLWESKTRLAHKKTLHVYDKQEKRYIGEYDTVSQFLFCKVLGFDSSISYQRRLNERKGRVAWRNLNK